MVPSPSAALVVVASLAALLSCRGATDDARWYAPDDACLRHDQCAGGLCVEGGCEAPAGDGPIRFGDNSGTRALVAASVCRWDDECGPWMCVEGECADPATAGVALPLRSELTYWDTSCLVHEDCGPWMCASGFCAPAGRIGPHAQAPWPPAVDGAADPCIADEDCSDGLDCRYPGFCIEGIADTPFHASDVPWDPSQATYLDASCNFDAECAGRICVSGWCIAPEFAGVEPLPRRQVNYYDGSCIGDEDCGTWTCVDFWCRDPRRVGADQGASADTSQAARARAEGVWTADSADLAQWVAADALAHGVGATDVETDSGNEADKWSTSGVGVLGALGSSSGSSIGVGSLLGSGMSGVGTGLGGVGYGGLGTGTSGLAASGCSSNADCSAGDACVYPGQCRPGGATEAFTTADIAFSARPGEACSVDDDCGPMFCRQSVCTPVEHVEPLMPPRSDIFWHDGSCDSPDDCGSWRCVGLWCRPN